MTNILGIVGRKGQTSHARWVAPQGLGVECLVAKAACVAEHHLLVCALTPYKCIIYDIDNLSLCIYIFICICMYMHTYNIIYEYIYINI